MTGCWDSSEYPVSVIGTEAAVRPTQVPITYTSEMSWLNELMRLAPTVLLIAGYVYFTRKTMGGLGGMGGGGGGGSGGRGIFNVGKAQVRTMYQ